ncbi:MAG: hypothetical protein K8F35_14990 [Dokdonella sp.]|uniref:hypothetical protein n=1 Tax=Dokdonella sp. TaxID=2291710 RepID=UPI0025C5CA58|nr:hypothetical protein [Dokdonella sp.]MBZ0224319.1 hypothetical protein [Dokdonella sp.]
MSLLPLIIGLYVAAALFALAMLAQFGAARTRWRARRRLGAGHRLLWALVFLLTALLAATLGTALHGYRRLTGEALVARIDARALAPQRYIVTLELPDGSQQAFEIAGDEWQLDARVIKWQPRAVLLGAPPLYRLERLAGRWHSVEQARSNPPDVHALDEPGLLDPWRLQQRLPASLALIDAAFGSSAWLPLVDGGHYVVTLAAAGGLIARPADPATAQALREAGWPTP